MGKNTSAQDYSYSQRSGVNSGLNNGSLIETIKALFYPWIKEAVAEAVAPVAEAVEEKVEETAAAVEEKAEEVKEAVAEAAYEVEYGYYGSTLQAGLYRSLQPSLSC